MRNIKLIFLFVIFTVSCAQKESTLSRDNFDYSIDSVRLNFDSLFLVNYKIDNLDSTYIEGYEYDFWEGIKLDVKKTRFYVFCKIKISDSIYGKIIITDLPPEMIAEKNLYIKSVYLVTYNNQNMPIERLSLAKIEKLESSLTIETSTFENNLITKINHDKWTASAGNKHDITNIEQYIIDPNGVIN